MEHDDYDVVKNELSKLQDDFVMLMAISDNQGRQLSELHQSSRRKIQELEAQVRSKTAEIADLHAAASAAIRDICNEYEQTLTRLNTEQMCADVSCPE